MTIPTPPAPGQVWRKGSAFLRIDTVRITKSVRGDSFEVEAEGFGDERPVTMFQEEWLKWSATATLVSGGDTDV